MARRLRLLWVTPELPRRGISAARERFWMLLARLATRHDVTLLTFLDTADLGHESDVPPGLVEVRAIPREPHAPHDPFALLPTTVRGGFAHPALARSVRDLVARGAWDLVHFEFLEMAHLLPSTDVPCVQAVADLKFGRHGARWRAEGRHLAAAPRALFRHLRDLDWELHAAQCFSHVITMTAEDADRLRAFLPDLPVSVTPVGVDTREFRPPDSPVPAQVDLLFVGNFDHPPNVDAVHFLADEIVPRLTTQLGRPPSVRVIGRGPIPALAAPLDVCGAVPDVRPHLAGARVVVAPVRFGGGMRGKIVEALAMARPVVTTSLGAQGLGAVSERDLLIADGADALAAASARLLSDPVFAEQLGTAGRRLVESRFDMDAVADMHDAIYEAVLQDHARRSIHPHHPTVPAADLVERLGPLPALAVGGLTVGMRGVRWYVRRGRAGRPRRAPSLHAASSV